MNRSARALRDIRADFWDLAFESAVSARVFNPYHYYVEDDLDALLMYCGT